MRIRSHEVCTRCLPGGQGLNRTLEEMLACCFLCAQQECVNKHEDTLWGGCSSWAWPWCCLQLNLKVFHGCDWTAVKTAPASPQNHGLCRVSASVLWKPFPVSQLPASFNNGCWCEPTGRAGRWLCGTSCPAPASVSCLELSCWDKSPPLRVSAYLRRRHVGRCCLCAKPFLSPGHQCKLMCSSHLLLWGLLYAV